MDDEALKRIERELDQIAVRLGQPEACEDRAYRQRPNEEAAETPLPIADRLREKIFALDRLLALHDRTTYDRAMGVLMDVRRPAIDRYAGELPRQAVLIAEDGDVEQWSFSELPDLTLARATLRSLISDLGVG